MQRFMSVRQRFGMTVLTKIVMQPMIMTKMAMDKAPINMVAPTVMIPIPPSISVRQMLGMTVSIQL